MASRPTNRTDDAADSTQPGTKTFPQPGPAPVGPAVSAPGQTPVATPPDPGPAPVGPAVGAPKTGKA